MPGKFLLVALGLLVALPAVPQEDPVRHERVDFAPGAASGAYTDSIHGFERVNYQVHLRAGQTLSVTLATNNLSNCFDITAPGAEKPLFVGSNSGNSHSFRAAVSGVHVIDVHLLRLAARDDQTALYMLSVAVRD